MAERNIAQASSNAMVSLETVAGLHRDRSRSVELVVLALHVPNSVKGPTTLELQASPTIPSDNAIASIIGRPDGLLVLTRILRMIRPDEVLCCFPFFQG